MRSFKQPGSPSQSASSGWKSAAAPDPETNFKLFGPVPSEAKGAKTTGRAFAMRLRPNQDFAGSIENFCREQGVARARIRGGVGGRH